MEVNYVKQIKCINIGKFEIKATPYAKEKKIDTRNIEKICIATAVTLLYTVFISGVFIKNR